MLFKCHTTIHKNLLFPLFTCSCTDHQWLCRNVVWQKLPAQMFGFEFIRVCPTEIRRTRVDQLMVRWFWFCCLWDHSHPDTHEQSLVFGQHQYCEDGNFLFGFPAGQESFMSQENEVRYTFSNMWISNIQKFRQFIEFEFNKRKLFFSSYLWKTIHETVILKLLHRTGWSDNYSNAQIMDHAQFGK